MNLLEQLKQVTKVVADTGDFESMAKYKPQDATTNPSLILSAIHNPKYKQHLQEAVSFGRQNANSYSEQLNLSLDKLAINFGLEILKIVPGRVSTEVDARLSFNISATIERARQLIALYEQNDVPRNRILIKVASTWEGILAASELEKEGIHCNLTLLFSLAQAIACAENNITLISPFVGRIMDWHKKARGLDTIPATDDPGVHSVRSIYNYFKKYDYKTEVMGASFRNKEEIIHLAGCDLLTISPKLLAELESSEGTLKTILSLEDAKASDIQKIDLTEASFRWMMNEDAMATEKLSEGIRNFSADILKIETLIKENL